MPFLSVDHFAGLPDADRKRLQVRLAEVVVETFRAPASSVRVFTRSFQPGDVYCADGDQESGLPVIRAEFLPGRTIDQKRALVKGLAEATAEVIQIPVDRIRIILTEKERQDWARGNQLVADQG